jgi:hypothetical protein
MSLPRSFAALASEILSATGLPGGNALQEATQRVLARRLEQAREILIEEIRFGEKHITQAGAEDEFAAILFRYQRAAIEGTARLNLRLLAAVAAGQATSAGFAADEFLAWAEVLASLRREELIFIATLRRVEEAAPPVGTGPTAISDPVWTRIEQTLVPDPFKTPEDVVAAASACTRTGLVAVTGGTFDQPVTFGTTPRLTSLLALANVEEVLGRERRRSRSQSPSSAGLKRTDGGLWVKVVGMLQQNWAMLAFDGDGVTIRFIDDASGIFDRIHVPEMREAERQLRCNGFAPFDPQDPETGFLRAPEPPFSERSHPNGAIYSSGRFWRSD